MLEFCDMVKKKRQPGKKTYLIALFVIVFLALGVLVVNKSGNPLIPGVKKGPSSGIRNIFDSSSARVVGNVGFTENEEIDTPVYEDTIKGAAVTHHGEVVKIPLKNDVADVYLVVPKGVSDVNYAELSEFREMPTTNTHVPLYPDLGYGVNVTFEGPHRGLYDPAYLVFDFSKGEVLEQMQALTNIRNRCDFSGVYFDPTLCRAYMRIPAAESLGKNYFAASPMYGEEVTPTFPLYSYYLGSDDLLVVRIDDRVVVVPQPMREDVVSDVIASSFGRYGVQWQAFEAMDMIRHLKLTLTDPAAVNDMQKKFDKISIKTLFAAGSVTNLMQYSEYREHDEAEMKRIRETLLPDMTEHFALNAKDTSARYFLNGVANIRLLYDARLKGSAKTALDVLRHMEQQSEEGWYTHDERVLFLEAALLLAGERTYGQNNLTSLVHRFARVLGTHTDYPTDSDADRSAFESAAEESTKRIKNKATGDAADTSGNPDASVSDLVDALGEAQLSGDNELAADLEEKIQEKAEEDLKQAPDDDSFLDAARACQMVSSGDCGEDRMKEILKKRCFLEIGTRNLRNFADQTIDQLICEQLFE